MIYSFTPPAVVGVPVVDSPALFPVHRIYCVGRNYEEHAKEMGGTGREAPFFFMKPADAVLYCAPDANAQMPYPTLTRLSWWSLSAWVATTSKRQTRTAIFLVTQWA